MANQSGFQFRPTEFTGVKLLERPPAQGVAKFYDPLAASVVDIRFQFLVLVVLPTILATIYYGLIASDLYVSRVEYIVRGVNSHQMGGFAALLSNIGISRTADDTSAVQSFIQSRAAIERLNATVDLRNVYGAPGADFLARYPRAWETNSFERLYARVSSFIALREDQSTGITSLEVQAFRAKDAKAITTELLRLAEDMVNGMNDRIQRDAITESMNEVDESRDNLVAVQKDLVDFRNKELLIDPTAFARVLLDEIGELSLQRSQAQADISQKSALAPDSPGLQSLVTRQDALTKKIDEERAQLAGNDTALAGKVSEYERLTLLLDLADRRYSNALTSLRAAQLEAQRQRIYIEAMVPPNLPDAPEKPERLRMILTSFVLGFAVFSVFWIITVGSKDHAQ